MVGKISVLLFEARPSKHRPSKHRLRTFMFRGRMLRKQRATLHLECMCHIPTDQTLCMDPVCRSLYNCLSRKTCAEGPR